MRKANQKAVILGLSTIIAGGALLPYQVSAASLPSAVRQQDVIANSTQQAIQHLIDKAVLHGYGNGQMMADQLVTNAELVKMIVLTLELTPSSQPTQPGNKWYDRYLNTASEHGLIDSGSEFLPNKPADGTQMASMIGKALQRDIKSVQYWMEQLQLDTSHVTRGDAASLLVQAEKAIRSASAQIVSIKALNQITFEVTFNQPMTLEDEATAAAQANFNFNEGNLKLVNQPRLKTGSVATYIVPVQTMEPGATYTLQYKGEQTFEVPASDEKIRMSGTRQVAQDTFEVDSFRENGVIDYGYLISAYSGGRGANAIVLDENNRWNGNPIQVISSLATRQATLTPEGGEPITVSYVGFTQSTDGKQEPKFRLPQGTLLEPEVTYTVSSDWFTLENDSFVAGTIAPLEIASVSQTDEITLKVELTTDPEDELFAYRSIQLEGSDGTTLTAQYKVQTRSGATGVFELHNGAKLVPGVSYEVSPLGNWATAEAVQFEAK